MTAPQPAAATGMDYMTVDELKARSKPRKYRNEPTMADGIRFDSKKEARRYRMLKAAESAGVVSELRRQVRYQLHCPGGLTVSVYVADFVYQRDGATVVEDVKSEATRKLPMYLLKKKWMSLEHAVAVEEW
jgi:hypothetical protein